ncbi:S1 family peptidase [Paraburkholderia youngii]|uniref:S1 family peptidase n=1 Tax=Paraburkholderia youngii TaxID=2782701 RepID=UPI003D1BDE8E
MEFEPFEAFTCEGSYEPARRALPFVPSEAQPFSPFPITDPFGLRNAIVPVFRQELDGRIFGMGTAFHVDGFGRFLTAYHVVDFVSDEQSPARPVLFLSTHAVVFGQAPIPPDCFAPATMVYAAMARDDDPLATLRGQAVQRPVIDVSAVATGPVGPGARHPQALPVRLTGWKPAIGEFVLAVGFPQLDMSEVDAETQRALLTEGMQGAYGRIVDVHPGGTSRSNPSPVFEVESDWPSGMSGGPVFNRKGEVVGIVSRSMRATGDVTGTGFAVDLGRAPEVRILMPTLDACNPGWVSCWGVFGDALSEPKSVHGSYDEAEAAAQAAKEPVHVECISLRIGTNESMRTPNATSNTELSIATARGS